MVMKLTVQKTRMYRSTRVPSSAMVKIRSPFLATDNGMATAISRAWRHHERRKICSRLLAGAHLDKGNPEILNSISRY
jgi:hypothetical protein